ncbi:leucine-rich repeat-containing protein 15 isoform X1 [Zeugodacus cucurbitae]|uniref:leucine-rich repeat-containing protein 15 isoform X1 n=1 Tax=Zeugodacus cucurbitae TaxID=28588 RepID=UPI0023D95594|nr:leucine-rich repeat-containing protein 15 isoform X1 [Zeugodacus cucurbitae]
MNMEVRRLLELNMLLVLILILNEVFTFPHGLSERKRSNFSDNKFSMNQNSNPCKLNACEIMNYLSKQFLVAEAFIDSDFEKLLKVASTDSLPVILAMVNRVRQIENRLRSIEQPVWRLVSASQKEWSRCTSGVCRCSPETKRFTCWNTNFISLPVSQVIPMNMESMFFCLVLLPYINIEFLLMIYGLISSCLYVCLYLDLSRNYFSTLHKDTFRGLTLLKELDLSNNILNFIPANLFEDLDSLLQLRLQNNHLENLDAVIFWKLRNLNLLDISKNLLSDLPTNLFGHTQRLIVINLSQNRIQHFSPELLQDQIVLEDLDMSRNEITKLQTGSLKHLKTLQIVDFSFNFISSISDNYFSGLWNLRSLILNNNRISWVSKELLNNLTCLITLDLSTNRISMIDGNAFSELTNMRELLLGQNYLSDIPDGLFNNVNSLISLNLFSNNLTTIESNDFQGLLNLEKLMLNNNILKKIEDNVFTPMGKLEKLRIDSNKLQYLQNGALSSLKKLVSVKLDKNPWHCDCHALYLARWIREFSQKLWDGQMAVCRGPGSLGGHEVGLLRYDDLCEGQWASMLSLSPRLPLRKHRVITHMNYTTYFNLYLKHIYTTTPMGD